RIDGAGASQRSEPDQHHHARQSQDNAKGSLMGGTFSSRPDPTEDGNPQRNRRYEHGRQSRRDPSLGKHDAAITKQQEQCPKRERVNPAGPRSGGSSFESRVAVQNQS